MNDRLISCVGLFVFLAQAPSAISSWICGRSAAKVVSPYRELPTERNCGTAAHDARIPDWASDFTLFIPPDMSGSAEDDPVELFGPGYEVMGRYFYDRLRAVVSLIPSIPGEAKQRWIADILSKVSMHAVDNQVMHAFFCVTACVVLIPTLLSLQETALGSNIAQREKYSSAIRDVSKHIEAYLNKAHVIITDGGGTTDLDDVSRLACENREDFDFLERIVWATEFPDNNVVERNSLKRGFIAMMNGHAPPTLADGGSFGWNQRIRRTGLTHERLLADLGL